MSDPCVHLHAHSEYSLLDGQPNIARLVARAAELGQPAIGLTDHGVMNGAVELFKAARAQGITPVIGCELYVVDDHAAREGKVERNHLTVLARDARGFENLMGLSSLGFTRGYYRGKPGIDVAQLAEHGEGLIVMTGCLAGRLCRRLAADRVTDARAHVDDLFEAVGRDNVYLEVQKNRIEEQEKCNAGIERIARETGRPLVGTADVHYLRKEDHDVHQALLCVQTQSTIANPKMSFQTNEFFVKSNEEMAADFAALPDALPTTLEIAERCDVEIPLGQQLLPRFLPEGDDEAAYLRERVEEGLRARYGDPVPGAARERAEMELGVITRMGYDAYFLIVWDFIRWAKEHGIAVGPGRGSAAGSIIAYTLKITDVDPLHYDLLFERFLNPDRVSMPDIDIDLSVRGREEVLRYVVGKYGRERVAQIATFGRMLPRAATKDAARVMGFDYQTGDRLAKLIPDAVMGKTPPLATCLAEGTELRAAYDADPVAKQVLDLAQGMEGTVRNLGIHAAAVVISDRDLTEVVPVQIADARTVDEQGNKVFRTITQYPMGPIEEIGLLKMDFLGLRNLDVIEDALDVLERSSGERIDITAIPLDDPKTYEMLARGDTIGVFQFESEGIRKAIRLIRPSEFDDVIALQALYRPGAMAQIPTYAAGKHDPASIRIPDPRLESIIRSTNGVILYQEQAMLVSRELAGFTPGQADDLRKAIGKKRHDKMAEIEPMFREGCLASGTHRDVIDWLWATNEASADYSFNKSHAACYGLVSYRTAWLKANHPSEYMAALLSSVMSTKDKVPFFLNTCEEMGIEVLPPDVNASDHDFTVHDTAIRFGLDAVKGVGHGAVEAIKAAREDGPFPTLWEFCERVDFRAVNGKALDSLIRCGAFTSTGATRQGMLAVVDRAQQAGKTVQQDEAAGQGSIFDLGGGGDAADAATVAGPASAATISRPPIPAGEFDQRELLAMEKETIGLFLSAHPLKDVRDALAARTDCGLTDLRHQAHDAWVSVGGMVVAARRMNTKKGQPMMRGTLEDTEGGVDIVVFPKSMPDLEPVLRPDEVVLVRGRVDLGDPDRPALLVQTAETFRPSEAEVDAARGAADARRSERDAVATPTEVHVLVDGRAVCGSTLDRLKHLITDHTGDASLVLTVMTSAGPRTLRLGGGFGVTPDATLQVELERLFGGVALDAGAAGGVAAPAAATADAPGGDPALAPVPAAA